MRNVLARFAAAVAVVFASLGLATPALAQANYTELTSAVDWSSVITALMTVAVAIIGVLIVRKGIRFVLGMIR